MSSPFVLRFDEIGIGDIARVGGSNASLGGMFRELSAQGVKMPPGFAITDEAYRYFLSENGLDVRIPELLAGLNPHLPRDRSQDRHLRPGPQRLSRVRRVPRPRRDRQPLAQSRRGPQNDRSHFGFGRRLEQMNVISPK